MEALHCKLAWSFIKGSSMGAQFMRQKYGSPSLVLSNHVPLYATHCWKMVLSQLPFFQNSKWLLGRGEIRFWEDNWLDNDLPLVHQQPHILVRDALPLWFWIMFF